MKTKTIHIQDTLTTVYKNNWYSATRVVMNDESFKLSKIKRIIKKWRNVGKGIRIKGNITGKNIKYKYNFCKIKRHWVVDKEGISIGCEFFNNSTIEAFIKTIQ